MHELRILSGLHRGASLPLDDEVIVIGSDEAADVVLLDPGIATHHARLRKTNEGWALASIDGEVRGADTNRPLPSLELRLGEFARAGRVWLTVDDADAPWADPPADPVDIEVGELQGEEADEREEAAPDAGAGAETKEEAAGGAPDNADEHASVQAGESAAAPPKRRSRLLLPAIAAAMLLCAWGTYQLISAGPSPLRDANAKAANSTQHASPEPTPAELRALFRKRLAEVGLLNSFDLSLEDDAWTMQAVLDDEEAARFERTLAAFIRQYNIGFPITAKVGNPEHMLPFRIRQVISGANASVITSDGNRLYVGDEYKGMRLVAVKGSTLTFMGRRKIDVRW